jgi:thiamine-monophosphate kinase
MPLDELSIIDRFLRPLAGEGAADFRDDAGTITVPEGQELVVTTDMVAAGIHFLPGDPVGSVAQKALRVNLSDLAAKGARPLCYTLNLGLQRDADEAWLAAFTDALKRDQETFGIGLLGGDTINVADGPVISIAAFGLVPKARAVRRFCGAPGDMLYVSGTIGAAAAGLALLRGEDGPWNRLPEAAREALVARYRVPEPRVALAAAIREQASAAMDISDGLVGDCDKLCAASGCSATLDAGAVPLPPGLSAVDAALVGRLLSAGDDYEILAAIPSAKEADFRRAAADAGIPVTRIGILRPGAGAVEVRLRGRPLPLSRRAYLHGGKSSQEERTSD